MEKKIIFAVKGKTISETCPLHWSSNTVDYIKASFVLDDEWKSCDVVRAAWSGRQGTIITLLDADDSCVVPHEVLAVYGKVSVNLYGVKYDDDGEEFTRITTAPVTAIIIDSTARIDGSETAPITPSQFEQFVQAVKTETEKVTGMTAAAETLPAGSDATASYSDGVLTLGIPRGDKGDTGPAGPQGIQGVPGERGEQGLQGERGPQGERGEQGLQGIQGERGERGLTGETGAKGDTGNGISSIVKTGSSGLIDTYTITFTDGTSTTFNVTNGKDGADAQVTWGTITGTLANQTDLQSALHDPEQLAEADLVTTLINKYRAIKGKYVNHNTGALGNNSSYYATDYIAVRPKAWYYGKYNSHYAWYDSNKTFISGASLAIAAQAPATAAYIRLDYTAANADLVCMNEGIYRTEDTTFSVEYPWLVSSKKIEPERIHTYGAFYLNMFNKLTATDGVYIEHTNGKRNTNASYFTSAPIPVDENTTYVMSVGNRYVAFDEHFQYISGERLSGANQEFTTPSGAKWIRVSNSPLTVKDTLVIAEKAHYTGAYEDYGIIVPWLSPANRSKYEGKKLVCFGDSITNMGYTQFISSVTGMNAQNVGLSSGRYAYSDDSNQYINAFALHNIVASISSGDWTVPDSISGVAEYSTQYAHIQDIKAIDFSTVDFVSIAYGTNDFSSATPMDNADNAFDTNTFKGAIRYCIKTLTEKYPHLKILGVTPCYRFWSENGAVIDDSDTHEINGFKLIDYVNAIKEVYTEYHLPVLDNYTNAGINSFNRLNYFSISDGLHPNINGREIIGQRIAEAIITQY